jgi:hypothetical protein
MPMGATSLITIQFTPLEVAQATRVVGACGKPQGSLPARAALGAMRSGVRREIADGVAALRKVILEELESGLTLRPQAVAVPVEQIAAAVSASVAESLAT